jgi:biopolymer transport protein ExbD
MPSPKSPKTKRLQSRYLRRLQKRREHGGFFEASSIGDLAFLLLIYFIVTSSFLLRQGIFLSLPSPDSGKMRVKQEEIVVVEPRPQGYHWQGKPMERSELKAKLQKRQKQSKKTIAVVRMNRRLKYERLVDALSLAREAGITKVSVKETDHAR